MNSRIIKGSALIALGLVANSEGVQAIDISHKHQLHNNQQGIFGKMIELAEAPKKLAEEKQAAIARKNQQLADAEKDYQRSVAEEEAEELAQRKKQEDEAEKAALEAAQNTPQNQILTAANEAASSINVQDMEATIQAQLQAKIDSGASKADLLASMDDIAMPAAQPPMTLAQPLLPSPVKQPPLSLAQPIQPIKSTPQVQSVMAQVLAKRGIKTKEPSLSTPLTPSAPFSAPAPLEQPASLTQKQSISVAPKPIAAPLPQAAVQVQAANVASTTSTAGAELKATQDKVKEMCKKLKVPFTNDLMALSSNSQISDVLIDKAVAAGRSEAEINAAMATF